MAFTGPVTQDTLEEASGRCCSDPTEPQISQSVNKYFLSIYITRYRQKKNAVERKILLNFNDFLSLNMKDSKLETALGDSDKQNRNNSTILGGRYFCYEMAFSLTLR